MEGEKILIAKRLRIGVENKVEGVEMVPRLNDVVDLRGTSETASVEDLYRLVMGQRGPLDMIRIVRKIALTAFVGVSVYRVVALVPEHINNR